MIQPKTILGLSFTLLGKLTIKLPNSSVHLHEIQPSCTWIGRRNQEVIRDIERKKKGKWRGTFKFCGFAEEIKNTEGNKSANPNTAVVF